MYIHYYIDKKNSFFICHIHIYTSSEICALHLTHPSAHTPGAVGSLAQGSHLKRGQFLVEPRFEPTTLGYKSDALSIRLQMPKSIGPPDHYTSRYLMLMHIVYSHLLL